MVNKLLHIFKIYSAKVYILYNSLHLPLTEAVDFIRVLLVRTNLIAIALISRPFPALKGSQHRI